MRLRRILTASVITLLMLGLCTSQAFAAKSGRQKSSQAKQSKRGFIPRARHFGGTSALPQSGVTLRQGVKLMDLSPVVRKHVVNLVGSGRLGTIIKVVKNGRLTYQVAYNRDGKHRDVTLDGSGQKVKP